MNGRPPSQTQEDPPRAARLTCFDEASQPYTRHASVEAEISQALGIPIWEWPGRSWRLETLAHLIRLRSRDNDRDVFGRLSLAFLERAKPIVDRWSKGYGPADTEEIQITVANELGDLLMQDPPTRTSDYLEIDAATIIKQRTLRVTGKHRPKASAFQSSDRDEDGVYTPTVDRLASQDLDPLEQLLAKADFEAGGPMKLLGAITDPRHREAFILFKLRDWPLKDGPPGTPTLCSRFKKSDRQIRSWIKKAIEQMRAAHGEEL